MTRRRFSLLAALTAFVALTLGAQVQARDPPRTDVTLEGHGGTTSGRVPMLCAYAPGVSARYGGGGVRARWRPRTEPAHPERGPEVVIAGAAEFHAHELVSPGSRGETEVPADQAFVGGNVSAGYNWRGFGFRGGVSVQQTINHVELRCVDVAPATPGTPSRECLRSIAVWERALVSTWPEVHLRFGWIDGLHGELGWGSYSVATALRPGLYAGIAYAFDDWQIAVRLGYHRSLLTEFQVRGDLTLHIPVHRHLRIVTGASFSHSSVRNIGDPEGRLAAELRF